MVELLKFAYYILHEGIPVVILSFLIILTMKSKDYLHQLIEVVVSNTKGTWLILKIKIDNFNHLRYLVLGDATK